MKSVCIVVFIALLSSSFLEAATAEKIRRDDQFIAYADGTVVDTRTNLMWAAADNGADINWSEAYIYCDEYEGGGYTDWRLPTAAELATLYRKDKSSKAGLHISKLLTLSDFMLWSADQKQCKAYCFDYISGRSLKIKGSRTGIARVLPVRSISR